jgi:hypothetical protein
MPAACCVHSMHELSQQMNVHRSVPRLPARETKANDSLEMCKRCVRRDQEEMSGEWPLQASECQGAMLVRDPLSAAGSEMYKGMFTILYHEHACFIVFGAC